MNIHDPEIIRRVRTGVHQSQGLSWPRQIHHHGRAWFNRRFPRFCSQAIYGNQESEKKISILVFTIQADLARLWWYYAKKVVDPSRVVPLIVDRYGGLKKEYFPGAKVIHFPWGYHAEAIDFFIRRVIKTPYVLKCDDDDFLLQEGVEDMLEQCLSQEKCFAMSFHPRENNGRMGTMCLGIKREIFIRENACFHGLPMEQQPSSSKADDGDEAEAMLKKLGYENVILDPQRHSFLTIGFRALSMTRAYQRVVGTKNVREYFFKIRMTADDIYGFIGCAGLAAMADLYKMVFKDEPQERPPFSWEECQHLVTSRAQDNPGLKESFEATRHVYDQLKTALPMAG